MSTASSKRSRASEPTKRPLKKLSEPLGKSEKQALGESARRLLQDTLFNLAYRSMRAQILEEIAATEWEQATKRETLYLELKVAGRFIERLADFIAVADQITEEERQNEERRLTDSEYDETYDVG